MTVQQLIDLDIARLAATDTVGAAVVRFAESEVDHLAVVDEHECLVALVAEDEVGELEDFSLPLNTVGGLGAISVGPDHHLFEAAALLAAHGLSALPVALDDGTYLGMVTRRTVFEQFSQMFATGTTGTILILETPPRDFSLSQLSHLVEQSDARILSVSTQSPHEGMLDPTVMRVTVKLNVTDTARVRHVLEHHGYHVAVVFNEDETDDELSLRVQEFMRYLEV